MSQKCKNYHFFLKLFGHIKKKSYLCTLFRLYACAYSVFIYNYTYVREDEKLIAEC